MLLFTYNDSCSSVRYISFNVKFYIFQCSSILNDMLKTWEQKITCSKRTCANGCERCLYQAYCIECGFLMADFDETSCSCENDKVEISEEGSIKDNLTHLIWSSGGNDTTKTNNCIMRDSMRIHLMCKKC